MTGSFPLGYNMKYLDEDLIKKAGWLGSIGWILAVCPMIGLAMGYYLDRFLGTEPWLLVIFLIIGMIAGFYEAIRMIIKTTKDDFK